MKQLEFDLDELYEIEQLRQEKLEEEMKDKNLIDGVYYEELEELEDV